jgi:hypothetical protein
VVANLRREDTSWGDGKSCARQKRKQAAAKEYNAVEVVTTFSSFRFSELSQPI